MSDWNKDNIKDLTKNDLLKYINNVKKNSNHSGIYEYLTHKYNMKDYPRETLIKVGEALWDHGYKPSEEWTSIKKN